MNKISKEECYLEEIKLKSVRFTYIKPYLNYDKI